MFETKDGTIKPIIYVGFIQNERLLLVKYKDAPNPAKNGWWIPAPGLGFGEDPTEKAESLASELGFSKAKPRLKGVESFVLPGGWHLIYHYTCQVQGEIKTHDNILEHKWVTLAELDSQTDIAHGKWEIGVAKSYLHH